MRMMMKVKIDTEAGSRGIQDGSLPQLMQGTLVRPAPAWGRLLRPRRWGANRIHCVRPQGPLTPGDLRTAVQQAEGNHRDVPGDESRGPEEGAPAGRPRRM